MKEKIVLSNQESIYFIDTHDENKEILLLIHGNMSSGAHYEEIIPYLNNDYRIIAPDLRGFGDSSYHKPIESLEDFADDLKDFLKHLNITQVHIAGWSTGGGIAMKFAAKYPKTVKKLILLESASYKGYPIYKKDASFQPILTELYQDKETMALDPVQVLPAVNAMDNNDIAFMKQVWLAAIYNVKVPSEDKLNYYLSETLKQRNLVDVDWALMTFNMSNEHNGVVVGDNTIKQVTHETLSIYGKKDLIILPYMYEETLKALPNAKGLVFDDFSHSPITDDPVKLSETILTFLQP